MNNFCFSRLALATSLVLCCSFATAQQPQIRQSLNGQRPQQVSNQQRFPQSKTNQVFDNHGHAQNVNPDLDSQTQASNELDAALLELETVHSRHTQVLQDLLTRVPPQARPGIENAIQKSQMGQQKARQARIRSFEKRQNRNAQNRGKSNGQPDARGGRPEWAGNGSGRDVRRNSSQQFGQSQGAESGNAGPRNGSFPNNGQQPVAQNSRYQVHQQPSTWNQQPSRSSHVPSGGQQIGRQQFGGQQFGNSPQMPQSPTAAGQSKFNLPQFGGTRGKGRGKRK